MLHAAVQATAFVIALSTAFWCGVYVAEIHRYDLLVGERGDAEHLELPHATPDSHAPAPATARHVNEQYSLDWLGPGVQNKAQLEAWLNNEGFIGLGGRFMKPHAAGGCYARVIAEQAERWARESRCRRILVAVITPQSGNRKVAEGWARLLPRASVFEIRGSKINNRSLRVTPDTLLLPADDGDKAAHRLGDEVHEGKGKFGLIIDTRAETFDEAKELQMSFVPYMGRHLAYFMEGIAADEVWGLRRYMGGQYHTSVCPLEPLLWVVSWFRDLHVAAAIEGAAYATTAVVPDKLLGPTFTGQKDAEDWLAKLEMRYGGLVNGLVCPGKRKCQGGDRMSGEFHNYAPCYARLVLALAPYWEELHSCGLTPQVAEIGILAGSGLAIWSDLFPGAEVHGFDLNLTTVLQNWPFLSKAGAFSANNMQLHQWDQYGSQSVNKRLLAKVVQGSEVVFAIDDGAHTLKSTRFTFDAFDVHLAHYGAWIVEDMKDSFKDAMLEFLEGRPSYTMSICPYNTELWVVTKKDVAPLLFPKVDL